MKKLQLFVLHVYSNLIKNLILYCGSFIATILLLFTLYVANDITTTLSYAKNGDFEDCVFVNQEGDSTIAYLSSKSGNPISYKDDLSSLKGLLVEDYGPQIRFFDLEHDGPDGNPRRIDIALPGLPTYKEMGIRISKGRYPDSGNEIAVCEALSDYFSLDDLYTVNYVVPNENGSYDTHPITFKIVGFLEKEPIFKSLDTRITKLSTLSSILAVPDPSIYEYYGFSSIPLEFTDDGVSILDEVHSNLLSCRSIDKRSAADTKSYILDSIPQLSGNVITGAELREAYIQENLPRIVRIVVLATISLLLLSSFLISALYLQVRKRSLEMTITYINGMTWFSSITMMFLSYLPGMVLGIICGAFSFFPISGILLSEECVFRWDYVLISSGICLILALLCMIPLYIELMRRPPVETIRKD